MPEEVRVEAQEARKPTVTPPEKPVSEKPAASPEKGSNKEG